MTAEDVDDGSSDPDGDTLTLSLSPAGPYELGDTTVTLTVDDGNGETDSCDAIVTVEDTTAPVPTCSVSTTSLWPVTNKMADVGLSASATDACDWTPALTVSIYSDEGNGTGEHSPDAAVNNGDLELRKERDGDADGRVYLIVITATDSAGNTATTCCTVVVPKSQSAADLADVADQAADAAKFCADNDGAAPAGFKALLTNVSL